jgi:hypothetical protein
VLSFKDTLKRGQASKNQIFFFPGNSTLALILCYEDYNTFLGNLFAKIRYVCIYVYICIYIYIEIMYLPLLKELTETLLYVH